MHWPANTPTCDDATRLGQMRQSFGPERTTAQPCFGQCAQRKSCRAPLNLRLFLATNFGGIPARPGGISFNYLIGQSPEAASTPQIRHWLPKLFGAAMSPMTCSCTPSRPSMRAASRIADCWRRSGLPGACGAALEFVDQAAMRRISCCAAGLPPIASAQQVDHFAGPQPALAESILWRFSAGPGLALLHLGRA